MSLPTKISNIFSKQIETYLKGLWSMIESLRNQLAEKSEKLEKAEAEIRRLKNLPKKPKIKPSQLDKPNPDPDKEDSEAKAKRRAGSEKRHKKVDLKIDETQRVAAKGVPENWVQKGYKSKIIQDFIIRSNNIEYQLEIWESPDGQEKIVADLAPHLQNTHFGPHLQAYILHQYNECGVSQPLISSSLADFGVDISTGMINNILVENKEVFHEEKLSLLKKAIELKEELRTDDTGARHEFKNGYCNCINSDLFTYFSTSHSKSRVNFLKILRLEREDYDLNEAALDYAKGEGLGAKYYDVLENSYRNGERHFENNQALMTYFETHNFTADYAVKIMTQALLVGTIIKHGFDPNTIIHSDGAGQFNIFSHSLCWKHAERPLIKLMPYTLAQQTQLEAKKKAFWLLYQKLKKYKETPNNEQALILYLLFDQVCEPVEGFDSLNKVLKGLKKKKDQLLLVLSRPKTSLHNNDSERDIREYVKRRKISAGTRSENGRKARDTFLSLKKTCRKLSISFWDYLLDRLQNLNQIEPLSLIMEQRSNTAKA